MKLLLPLLAAALTLTPSRVAQAGTVQTVITNIPDDKGTIRVALCRKDEFLRPSCAFNIRSPARAPDVSVTFDNVPAGIYAVQVYQDRNKNGKLDRSFLGIPEEPVGFSNNPALHFGPPGFAQCALLIGPSGGKVIVSLITGTVRKQDR